jgi:hypothetical protein
LAQSRNTALTVDDYKNGQTPVFEVVRFRISFMQQIGTGVFDFQQQWQDSHYFTKVVWVCF